jgi:hypothetical protein|nr:MAG TPA: hypothetical protein [Caudoviricetes sp.]DAS08428.1 MAG TPA: hypothetical protein [Caudoviricetes sp.]
MGLPAYFRKSNDSLFYDGNGTLKVYVPEKQFDLNIAKIHGDFIDILGIVPYAIEDKNGKMSKLHKINYPTVFTTKPSSIEKLVNVTLTKESKPQDYRVLNFVNGSPLVVSLKVPQDSNYIKALLNLFIITGNIPNTIAYDRLHEYLDRNVRINGSKYGISMQLWGVIFSELCRSKKDVDIPFRLSKDTDMYNYNSISVKEVSKILSSFAAIQSENFDDSVIHAMLTDNESNSPLEKILMNGF